MSSHRAEEAAQCGYRVSHKSRSAGNVARRARWRSRKVAPVRLGVYTASSPSSRPGWCQRQHSSALRGHSGHDGLAHCRHGLAHNTLRNAALRYWVPKFPPVNRQIKNCGSPRKAGTAAARRPANAVASSGSLNQRLAPPGGDAWAWASHGQRSIIAPRKHRRTCLPASDPPATTPATVSRHRAPKAPE